MVRLDRPASEAAGGPGFAVGAVPAEHQAALAALRAALEGVHRTGTVEPGALRAGLEAARAVAGRLAPGAAAPAPGAGWVAVRVTRPEGGASLILEGQDTGQALELRLSSTGALEAAGLRGADQPPLAFLVADEGSRLLCGDGEREVVAPLPAGLVGRSAGVGAPAPPPRAGWSLRVEVGAQVGARFPLGGRTVVGRGDDADVRLSSKSVSRRHAELRSSGDGLEVTDLGSSNGTWVDGARIAGPTRLGPGARFQLGEVVLVVEGPVAPPAAALDRTVPDLPAAGCRSPQPPPARCRRCGDALAPGDRFCQACGCPTASS